MMKTLLLATLCATLVLPFSGALAQDRPFRPVPSPLAAAPARDLDGNYVLTLVANGKDQPARELSIVVATPAFNATSGDPTTAFNGTCTPAEDGTYLISYVLGRTYAVSTGSHSTEYRNASTQASVRLHLGETAQIIKDGDQTYTLKVDRYKPEAR